MESHEIKVRVGDRVVISRPDSNDRLAPGKERRATVEAVRTKSFDAGGLCFRYDGREWNGQNRIRLIPREQDEIETQAAKAARAENFIERAEHAREDVILAFVLSRRHQNEWLKLGLPELTRIAALHGIASARTEALNASQQQLATLPPLNPWEH